MRVLVTGGLGFIGSNFIHHWLGRYKSDEILNLDCGTYAADQKNVEGVDELRYFHSPVDLRNYEDVVDAIKRWGPHAIVHFAAESHVDNSINGPRVFVESNVVGTFNLLEALREALPELKDFKKMIHVSTDEVYGSLEMDDLPFTETTRYKPRSPYAASKAASDHLVMSYFHTYKLPVMITNCSNNFGPRQHKEKFIPTVIRKALAGEKIPVYGNGKNVRDWIPVEFHCKAIEHVFNHGLLGETYCVGGDNEWKNIDLAKKICGMLEQIRPVKGKTYRDLIAFVEDRKGHDMRYAIDAKKLEGLGFKIQFDFDLFLKNTIAWYINEFTGGKDEGDSVSGRSGHEAVPNYKDNVEAAFADL